MTSIRRCLGMWLLIASVANAQPATNVIGNELEVAARRFVTLMDEGDYETAIANFDETMTKLVPASKLEQIWKSITAAAGPLKQQTDARKEKVAEYDIIFVTCEFKRLTLDAKVVFDQEKMITGLFFVPPKPKAEYKPPVYV